MSDMGEVLHSKEDEFRPEQTAVITSTFYPNWKPGEVNDFSDTQKVRGDLGLKFITKASELGVKVVVAESGSSQEFLSAIENLPNVHIEKLPKPSMGPGKKRAAEVASEIPGIKVIIRCEPEKHDALNYLDRLCAPIFKGQADVVVGRRAKLEFHTYYPDYAWESEELANRMCNELLRSAGIIRRGDDSYDFYSGFIAFRNEPKTVDPFMQRYAFEGDKKGPAKHPTSLEGWSHAQMFGIVLALNNRLKVMSVEIPFKYAVEQKQNEEHPLRVDEFKAKRKFQRDVIVDDFKQLVRFLKNMPKNKLVSE